MRKRAMVLETYGKTAKIEVRRATMCEGCTKNGGCGSGHCDISGLISNGGNMSTIAENSIGAKAGDTVEIETDSRLVLGYSAIVFIVPIVVAVLFYLVAEELFHTEEAGLIGAAVGFVISFVFCKFFDKFRGKFAPDIKIVKILNREEII